MRMHHRFSLLIVALLLGLWSAGCGERTEPAPPPDAPAAGPVWPDLPVRGFITDRPATEADQRAGDAAFSFLAAAPPGMPPPTPLDLTIPQYATHTDPETGKVTRATLIQAAGPAPDQR